MAAARSLPVSLGSVPYEEQVSGGSVRRIAAKRGQQRAIVAVAHSILVAAFYMLSRNEPYREAGGNYFEWAKPSAPRRYLVKRLELLGHKVILQPATAA